jgi:hypothetical protein
MRYSLVILLIFFYCSTEAQPDYRARLRSVIETIKKSQEYDNSVVQCSAESNYCSGYLAWNPNDQYYNDDIVAHNNHSYRALSDSRGATPSDSSKYWALFDWPRPYFFLRDTARVEDLQALLKDNNPQARCYAVAALVSRNITRDLFDVVVQNLEDTTRFVQYTGDFGYDVCAADVMMWYTLPFFSTAQKNYLRQTILRKYTHLNTLDEILLFHRPSPDDYRYVKALLNSGPFKRKFVLVALAAYQKSEDVSLILSELNNGKDRQYYSGEEIILRAIENFPEPDFKSYVMNMHSTCPDLWLDDFYIRALASYKDQDVLKKIEALANCTDSRYEVKNLTTIYLSLLRHPAQIYEPLRKRLQEKLGDKGGNSIPQSRIDDSPWNY